MGNPFGPGGKGNVDFVDRLRRLKTYKAIRLNRTVNWVTDTKAIFEMLWSVSEEGVDRTHAKKAVHGAVEAFIN